MGEHAHSHHGGHHDHSHMHSPEEAASMRPRLLVAFTLALVIVLAQAVGSLVTGSLALLTDTAHAITDASGLLVALTAASLMTRPATSRHTWASDALRCWRPWASRCCYWPWVSTRR